MKVVLIDNYDSFTYNLAQYLEEQTDVELTIIYNDAFQYSELDEFDRIVISPGPGLPFTSGQIIKVIRYFSGKKPILGICLGLQAIYEAFDGTLLNLPDVHHGVTSIVNISDPADPLFHGISNPFQAGRYHSWVCDPASLPKSLLITSVDQQGTIMSCRHTSHPTFGVQFHPESILTPAGKKLIENFIRLPFM